MMEASRLQASPTAGADRPMFAQNATLGATMLTIFPFCAAASAFFRKSKTSRMFA